MQNKCVTLNGLAMVLVLLICGHGQGLAAGGISIAPTRVIMDGNSRIATIYLSNKGDKAATFRVMLRDKQMLPSGQIANLEEGQTIENSALDFIRFSPRRVVIPAYGNQTVRLKLQNPKSGSLARGEYRTHLVFQSIPEAAPESADGRLLAQAIIESAIPVIVRRQKPTATVTLSEARVDSVETRNGKPCLNLVLNRDGERSIYGDIRVELITWENKSVDVARINGLAVYFPTPRREMIIPLDLPEGVGLQQGQLRVHFKESAAGKGDLEASLIVPLNVETLALK